MQSQTIAKSLILHSMRRRKKASWKPKELPQHKQQHTNCTRIKGVGVRVQMVELTFFQDKGLTPYRGCIIS